MKDDLFDVVWCEDGFSHIPDRLSLLRECRRVLKPRGFLVFSDLLTTGLLSKEAEDVFCQSWCLVRLESSASYAALLSTAGFKLISNKLVGREMVGVQEQYERKWRDAGFEAYLGWLKHNESQLISLWGRDGYRLRYRRFLMYPYLRLGRLEQGFFVARDNRGGRGRRCRVTRD